jgi:OmcA/MtrC family decaheme c-type cytochrome
LPSDLTGSPSFLFAYTVSQDGITTPADFNNLGRTAGQPQTISIADLVSGSAGTLTFSNGTCTATVPNPYPAGAKMRSVGLQGYYTQKISGEDVGLHTQSVLVTITGDTPRRLAADTAGCAACHEFFEGHGGNRVFTKDGGVEICTTCHNPNLSSSGRAIYPEDAAKGTAAADLGNTDTLTWPEATNNFKDMIHGIHASAFRTTDYEFVRNRNNGLYFNWSEVTFPGDISDCNKCHIGDTYLPDQVPEGVLMTTNRTTGVASGQDQSQDDVRAARDSVPNGTDWVITPVAASCYACHDGSSLKTHMEQFGGVVNENRDMVSTVDTCGICHGAGSIADVEKAHGLSN